MRLRIVVFGVSALARPPRNVFSALHLDRASERRDDAQWVAGLERAADTRFVVLDADGRLWADRAGDQPRWLDARERKRLAGAVSATLLGLADGRACFALVLDAAHVAAIDDGDGQFLGLRAVGTRFDAFHAGLAAYACGLARWQAATRFCGVCGAPLVLVGAGHRAVCTSAACARAHFPRSDPAVIMTVEHGDALLLGRQANWAPGVYSTLAGFVEPGEALEDAVVREVAEETGVEVIDCRYQSSQPWPFPASLMVGFRARARSREIAPRDGELEDARWFTRAQIDARSCDGSLVLSSPLSISRALIDAWRAS